MSLNDLRNRIDRAAQAYYYGQPIMTDAAFDALLKQLGEEDSNDPRLTRVGFPVPTDSLRAKVKHTAFTGSLRKCEDEKDLRKWAEKYHIGDMLVQLKADGSTAVAYYINGKLDKVVTRGGDDGVGEDVTANAVMARGVPTTLSSDYTGAIRGEMVLPVADWKRLREAGHIEGDEDDSNPRNIGNGYLRRVEQKGPGAENLQFIAFSADGFGLYEHATYLQLGIWGFKAVDSWLCHGLSEAMLCYEATRDKRNELPYWIDGIVFKIDDIKYQENLGIKDNRPEGQRVLKFESPGAETTLVDIVLSYGHTGAILPNARLEPCQIAGTTVSNVFLNNFDMIDEMDLAIGDKIRVIKANDIIPKVVEVIERPASRRPFVIPTACPVCGGKVGRQAKVDGGEGRVLHCLNADCDAKSIKRLNTWIKKLDIKNIGDAVLSAFIAQLDVKTPSDFYRIASEPTSMAFMPGTMIGKKKLGMSAAQTIIDEINNKKTIPLHVFVGSLGVKHLGRRRAQLIMEAVPGKLDTLDAWVDGKTLLAIAADASIPGIAAEISAGLLAFQDEITRLLQYVTIQPCIKKVSKVATTGKMSGRTVCFTGKIEKTDPSGSRYTRKMLEQLVIDNGGSVSDDVRAGVSDLVQANITSQSSKSKKAAKLGVNLMSEEAFFKLIS